LTAEGTVTIDRARRTEGVLVSPPVEDR
jgi:hypothetical protein